MYDIGIVPAEHMFAITKDAAALQRSDLQSPDNTAFAAAAHNALSHLYLLNGMQKSSTPAKHSSCSLQAASRLSIGLPGPLRAAPQYFP